MILRRLYFEKEGILYRPAPLILIMCLPIMTRYCTSLIDLACVMNFLTYTTLKRMMDETIANLSIGPSQGLSVPHRGRLNEY